MANEEHVQKLREGAEVWNEWVKEQPEDFRAELSGADLREAKLREADLSKADLFIANLSGADLREARLNGANLRIADLSKADLRKADLRKADLGKADLRKADLSEAKLNEVKLAEANLSGANLSEADLSEAKLFLADLSEAKLFLADLSGANFILANLSGANFSWADLSKTDLFRTNLSGADLSEANLSDADLRSCRNLRLDGNFVRNARFSPNAQDQWSVLRRTYTGPKFALFLLALLIFVAPYIINATYWWGTNQTQEVIEDILVWAENNPDEAPALLLEIATDELGLYRTPCLIAEGGNCKQMRVWQLVIGAHRGGWYVALALGLIAYNICRSIITVNVVAFREEEERSGHAPSLKAVPVVPVPVRLLWDFLVKVGAFREEEERLGHAPSLGVDRWRFLEKLGGYEFYYQLHRVADFLFYLSILSFGVHLLPKLFLPVSIPVGGG